jgi:hypothetical protein
VPPLTRTRTRLRVTQIHQETYGKSGSRRIVPGQYLAVDPKGRAVMIAAVEKSKLVYVLNRDTAANLTISSPLEAHKSHNICFALVALDMGCARLRGAAGGREGDGGVHARALT